MGVAMADTTNRLGEFLRARRALVTPEQVGLPDAGRRRVAGLRREELALLAGVSVDYYVRLEQGRDTHPSPQVLDALARALRLDDDAVAHLHDLARPAPRRRRPRGRPERVRPGVLRLLESWSSIPAFVLGRRMDVLAYNALAGLLHGDFAGERNIVRVVFLHPSARETYPDWDAVAQETVATLRAASVADLDDPALTELVGELSLKSEAFRRLWARHDVAEKASGTKRIVHPLVGEIVLGYETLRVADAPEQLVVGYHAEPGSASERALALLQTMAAEQAVAPVVATA
jgi:transcriptional regulator with XRE-family HTH domain